MHLCVQLFFSIDFDWFFYIFLQNKLCTCCKAHDDLFNWPPTLNANQTYLSLFFSIQLKILKMNNVNKACISTVPFSNIQRFHFLNWYFWKRNYVYKYIPKLTLMEVGFLSPQILKDCSFLQVCIDKIESPWLNEESNGCAECKFQKIWKIKAEDGRINNTIDSTAANEKKGFRTFLVVGVIIVVLQYAYDTLNSTSNRSNLYELL